MGYVEKSLSKEEVVLENFKFHWIVKFQIFFLILISPLTFGISLIAAIYRIVELLTTEQALTNKRIIFKSGFIARKTEEINLNRVETIEIEQGIVGRILGYGNVKITGTGTGLVMFKWIVNPLETRKIISETL